MTKGVIGPNKKDSKNSEKLQNCLLKLENVLHNRWRLLQHSSMNSVLSLIWAVLTGSALYQLKSSLEQQCDCSEIDFREICQGRVNQQVIILRTTSLHTFNIHLRSLCKAQKDCAQERTFNWKNPLCPRDKVVSLTVKCLSLS